MICRNTGKRPSNMEADGFFVKESLQWEEIEALSNLIEQRG